MACFAAGGLFLAEMPVVADSSRQDAPVEKTGQTTCYDDLGTEIPCTGTGQDGDIQAGVDWPSPRFTDNGDGTVTDNLTGLVWMDDANCWGTEMWANALGDCNTLASGSCGLTDGSSAGDWRLPHIQELNSLVDLGNYDPALPSGHPFSNVQSFSYWSSTTYALWADYAWAAGLLNGYVDGWGKDYYYSVWCVRGGL